jgi:hypothetical protein
MSLLPRPVLSISVVPFGMVDIPLLFADRLMVIIFNRVRIERPFIGAVDRICENFETSVN